MPLVGVEPTLLAKYAPKAYVYASFTTAATFLTDTFYSLILSNTPFPLQISNTFLFYVLRF